MTKTHVLHTLRQCTDACLACYQVCTETARECMERGGEHSEPKHVTMLMDCAAVCQLTAGMMLRNSPRHYLTGATCAIFCDLCAKECAHTSHTACAEACRTCAGLCHHMAANDASLPYNLT